MSRSAHPAGPRYADVLPEGHYTAPPADLNALDPKIWPLTTARSGTGAVSIGGLGLADLAEEFGTALFVLDEADFRARCRAWRDAFGPDADVFYAGKAFLSRAVVRWLTEEGLNLDVCSGGELSIALAGGMPPERIALHGNNKSSDELHQAIEAGVGRIVVDSFQEIVRVAHIADRLGRRQPVQIRVTVGVEAHTHEFIATAHEDQKFGFSLADGQAGTAVDAVLASSSLRLVGLHSHIGSQIFDAAAFEVSARRLVDLHCAIRDRYGIELAELGRQVGQALDLLHRVDDDAPDPDLERTAQLGD